MDLSLVRRAHNATNTLHSFIYFSPEYHEHLVSAGLRPGRMPYFAGRAAPMGAVTSNVVAATFYNFEPSLVAESMAGAWRLADPATVVAARFAAADAALTRLLGADVLTSPDVAVMGRLARQAVEACEVAGRPLFAGQLELDWPEPPHLALWHAVSMLREHRGDGHIAALVGNGLNGLEALVTHVATGQGFVPSFAKASRGWSDEGWDAAVAALVDRGVLDADGVLTSAGDALRLKVETETDQSASAPWKHLGIDLTEDLIRIGDALTAALRAAEAIPLVGVYAATP